MIWLNGAKLRVPDSLRLRYLLPEGATPATAAFCEVEGLWHSLSVAAAKDVLRAAAGQITLTVFDPAKGQERSFAARLLVSEMEAMATGYANVRLKLKEVGHG